MNLSSVLAECILYPMPQKPTGAAPDQPVLPLTPQIHVWRDVPRVIVLMLPNQDNPLWVHNYSLVTQHIAHWACQYAVFTGDDTTPILTLIVLSTEKAGWPQKEKISGFGHMLIRSMKKSMANDVIMAVMAMMMLRVLQKIGVWGYRVLSTGLQCTLMHTAMLLGKSLIWFLHFCGLWDGWCGNGAKYRMQILWDLHFSGLKNIHCLLMSRA